MKRYIWILLIVCMSIAVYGAKTSQEVKMDVYGISVVKSEEDQKADVQQPNEGPIMLSGKVDEEGKLDKVYIGSYLNKYTKGLEESVVLNQEEDTVARISSMLSDDEGTVYLSLYGETLEEGRQVQVIYEALLEDEAIKGNVGLDLRLVYTPVNERDLGFKALPYIEALNINIHSLEDTRQLLKLQQKGTYEIVVSDYLAKGYGEALSEGLDAISKFYYDVLLDKPLGGQIKLENIFVCSDLKVAPPKYTAFYEGLYKELQPMDRLDTSTPHEIALGIINSQLQLLVRPIELQEVEYVEYKVNEVSAGQSFRYPYVQKIQPDLLHEGTNQIKIVMKLKGKNEYGVNSFYIHNEIINKEEGIQYKERSTRKEVSYSVNEKPLYKKPYIPVLMYHKFKDQVEDTKEDQSMSVSTRLFEEQLKVILEAGYIPINFKQLQDYLEGKGGLPNKPFILTTDDGYLCNYEKAYPIMKKYNVQGTFFVTSLYMGVENSNDHFTWEQALEMEQSGLIDIQSHTHGHTLLKGINQVDVEYEVEKSFADIEKYLGKRDVKVLAYPQFLHTKTVKEWVKASGVDLQVTNLAKSSWIRSNKTTEMDIKRIHVSNDLSPEELLRQMNRLTH